MAQDVEIIGEVIEASTTEFQAECRTLHCPPPFGSFVKVLSNSDGNGQPPTPVYETPAEENEFDPFREQAGRFNSDYRRVVEGESTPQLPSDVQDAVYAVVYHASTSSVDKSRRLRAYWKDEQQLNDEQPELFEWMLVTDFRAIIIGHSQNGRTRQFLPQQPPRLLSAVRTCTPEDIKRIIPDDRMDFLRTLSNSRSAPSEEVVAACIREANAARGGDFEFLVAAGKELAGLLKDDYDRLQAIMRRVAL